MALFLTVFEGVTPADAQPIIAIQDPEILATLRSLLFQRLNTPDHKALPLSQIPGRGQKKVRTIETKS
jgi:hypothetical protein